MCALVTGVQTCALPISACATAPTAVIRAASLAAQTRRAGWANRAQTATLSAACVFNRAKSASLRTAYLAANPSWAKGKTLGGINRFAVATLGRASCRERVCQYVEIAGVYVTLTN